MNERIYLDNAATSWPKPAVVVEAVTTQMTDLGGAAGRGAYRRGMQSDQIVTNCRNELARLIGAQAGSVVLAVNGTHALNIAVQGFVRPGDHVVTTQIEHNSVLRPLAWLQRFREAAVTIVPCDRFGFVDCDQIRRAMQANTRLVVISHASNVTGAVQEIAAVGEIVRQHGAVFLVDAAQTLGHVPIDVGAASIDMLAASGHKGCLGPLGTGMLYLSESVQSTVQPLIYGGTGTQSAQSEMPQQLPARHEAGNLNVPAIAGWLAALRWLQEHAGTDRSIRMADRFADDLATIGGIRVLRDRARRHVPVVSIAIEGWQPTDAAGILDAQFGIEARAGLHCAPRIHAALGSESGTLRFSLSRFTEPSALDQVLHALKQILGS